MKRKGDVTKGDFHSEHVLQSPTTMIYYIPLTRNYARTRSLSLACSYAINHPTISPSIRPQTTSSCHLIPPSILRSRIYQQRIPKSISNTLENLPSSFRHLILDLFFFFLLVAVKKPRKRGRKSGEPTSNDFDRLLALGTQ